MVMVNTILSRLNVLALFSIMIMDRSNERSHRLGAGVVESDRNCKYKGDLGQRNARQSA